MYKIYVKGLRKINNIFKHKKFNIIILNNLVKVMKNKKTRDKDYFEYIYEY